MRVGVTFIAFDHLHAGYVQMLEEAKTQCDYLIVGLQTNPNLGKKIKTISPKGLIERYIQLNANKYVDEIIPYQTEQDLEDILRAYQIHVRIIGEEYKGKDFSAKTYCLNKGIDIYYNKR
ncbi:adenylyltransferase/cytidyltransferase family protein [Myroides pelagicus]|uniref:adenylyltransferase/cytidyltransferase family protein n=1 Tax=Myroides pelagicus TaxID=270914 RepID=UPI002DB71538|nr:adenylyltransferase/cytidyltransferase family protein [Myroides pelagicus]MEC4114944.1 adenylyltransferase/cytidyltransferase family protein [Myroides pelagicus]